MKANKFFAVALAALTLVACNKKDDPTPTEDPLTLNPTALNMEVGDEATVTANIEVGFECSNPDVATVVPANDGKSAMVTAKAEGSAVITAKSNGGQVKTCVVAVKKKGGEGAVVKGSQIWPIILDGTTYEANASKVVASFQPNDVDQFLYVWEGTYVGGQATGLNFYGNGDGYTALVVAAGWSGCGFCLTENGNGWQAAEALRAAIVAAPDDYFLHLAIKSTDNANHCFYFMGNEGTKFVLGAASVYDGPVYANFERDGAWQEFDIPMSKYASALASAQVAAGVNVFVALTEGVSGYQLNLDAVYFYKK